MITFLTFHLDPTKEASELIANQNILLDYKRDYMRMIELLSRSTKIFHPDCEFVLLTDQKTNLLDLDPNIRVCRYELESDKVTLSKVRALREFINQDGEPNSHFVLADSDVLINANLDRLFEQPFDIGLTYRDNLEMPFNSGLIYVKNNGDQQKLVRFFDQLLDCYCREYLNELWYGDQYVLIDAVGRDRFWQRTSESISVGEYEFLMLPCELYNFSPENMFKSIFSPLSDAKAIHFKGPRKRLILPFWKAHLAYRERSGLNIFLLSVQAKLKILLQSLKELLKEQTALRQRFKQKLFSQPE